MSLNINYKHKNELKLKTLGHKTQDCDTQSGFIRDYLQNFGVERMEWPVCSPDLNINTYGIQHLDVVYLYLCHVLAAL